MLDCPDPVNFVTDAPIRGAVVLGVHASARCDRDRLRCKPAEAGTRNPGIRLKPGHRVAVLFIVLLAALPTAVAAANADASAPEVASPSLTYRFLVELARTQIHMFLFATLKGLALGAILGLLLAIGWTWLCHRLGFYRSGWRYAGWVRWPLWILVSLVGSCFLGLAGFWQGAARGAETVLVRSQIGTRLMPELGRMTADGLAALQVLLTETNRSSAYLKSRIEAFHAGSWEVNAPEFIRQLERVKTSLVDEVLPNLEQQAFERMPQLRQEPARTLVRLASSFLTASLVETRFNEEMRRIGAGAICRVVRDRLVQVAARSGNPDTIGARELSSFLVNEGIVPAVMAPIRSFCHSQRMLCLLVVVCVLVPPPLVFRFTCGLVPEPNPPARTG